MRIVRVLPFAVRDIEHTWIPLSDGARLSARMWLPQDAGAVPAIIEYIPYRKRDDTRWRDEPMHGYFAGHGYASLRIDVRGSGTSDGILTDEYSQLEWSDALEALAWVAAQPWCDGRVGLIGKSWGGINALQIAALQPSELRCVIAVCASDDRWATDAHWMGGCLLTENQTWGTVLQTLAVRPQDPALVGDGWRTLWLRRLREVPLFAGRWLRHATRDAYWNRGSVSCDYSRIRVPVWAVSGWADGYADAVPRLLAGLPGIVHGWVGPWAHTYPHNGVPGPSVGFLQSAVQWWDRWLRQEDVSSGEPTYRVWMTDGESGARAASASEGRWVSETAWPSDRIRTRERALGTGSGPVEVPWTGAGALAAGAWCPFTVADLPGEQSPDDRASATFDLPPLTERLEILGCPEVTLELVSDRPDAMVAVRLCDVAPDGTSVRVSYGLLDLGFREGFGERVPVEPGVRFRVDVPLRHCAWAFPAGHRVRVAVSSSYWPIAWPPAAPVTLRVVPGASTLRLPERPIVEEAPLPPLPPPEVASSPALDVDDPPPGNRRIHRDTAAGEIESIVRQGWDPSGEPSPYRVEPIGLETGWGIEERFTLRSGDPGSATCQIRHVATASRGDWSTRVEVQTLQTRSRGGFRLRAEVLAHEGGQEVEHRVMEEDVPAS